MCVPMEVTLAGYGGEPTFQGNLLLAIGDPLRGNLLLLSARIIQSDAKVGQPGGAPFCLRCNANFTLHSNVFARQRPSYAAIRLADSAKGRRHNKQMVNFTCNEGPLGKCCRKEAKRDSASAILFSVLSKKNLISKFEFFRKKRQPVSGVHKNSNANRSSQLKLPSQVTITHWTMAQWTRTDWSMIFSEIIKAAYNRSTKGAY
uniref:Uncharacterized protein n=1 Tax=Trichuris muris TaxID=70415 RepID=A0A5S6R584_TRIMR